jgi:uncharacterized protein (TIGR02611 family)
MTSIRKLLIIVLGWLLLVVGAIMLLTPGPGLLAIASGLAILSTEYAWAKHLLRKVRAMIKRKEE